MLAAAQQIVFSRGVSALRMAELAFEQGMSTKTLYTHFASKEVLLEAIMDAFYHHYAALYQAVLDDPVLDFLSRLKQTMRLGWDINNALTAEATQDFRRNAPALLRGYEQKKEASIQAYFYQLLTEGKQQGRLRASLQIDILVDILMEIITYRLTLSELQKKNYTLSEAFETFFELLLAGMLNEEARQELARRD